MSFMRRTRPYLHTVGRSALLFVFLLTASFGPVYGKDAQGLINIGFIGDMSGPLGFWNTPRMLGAQDAIDYINNEWGGIRGRKLRLEIRDHQSNAGLHLQYYNELKAKTYHFMHTCGTGEQQLAKPQYEEDQAKIFFTCSMSPGVIYPVGHVFGTGMYYPDQVGAFFDWVVENWDYAKQGRRPRVAVMTYGSAYGRVINDPQVLAHANKVGIDVVTTIYIPFVTTDPLPPLQKAKQAGADWVVGMYLWQTLTPSLKANKTYDLGLKFWVTNMGVDDVIISQTGDAAESLTSVTSWRLPNEKSEGMRLINQYIKDKKKNPQDCGSPYIIGWMNMIQTKMALEETLDRVKEWDRVSVRELMQTLVAWKEKDILGLAKFSYSPTERGPSTARVVQVQKGQWKIVKDWFTAASLVPEQWMVPVP